MKINWHAIFAAAVTTFGVASSPAILGVLPPKAAAVVAGIGILYQAFTKPAAQSEASSGQP